jgi:hypothetical protein
LPSSNGWTSDTANSWNAALAKPDGRPSSRANPSISVPLDQVGLDEHVRPRLVAALLEVAGPVLGPPLHDRAVAPAQQSEQVLGVVGDGDAVGGVGDHGVGAEHVVGVLGAAGDDLTRGHDPLGLLEGELGALDEVGEVGLEERQGPLGLAVGGGDGLGQVVGHRGGQVLGQLGEAPHPVGVGGTAAAAGGGRGQPAAGPAYEPGADRRRDHLLDRLPPLGDAEPVGDVQRVGPQVVEVAVLAEPALVDQPAVDLVAAERAGEPPCPGPGQHEVVDQRPGVGGDVEPAGPRQVVAQRRRVPAAGSR